MTDKERAGPVATGLGPDPQSYLAGRSRSENTAPVRDSQDAGRAAWAARIEAAWRSAVDGVLETGRLLAEAKANLPHGAFTAMIEADLPFKPSTAQRLMRIAADERLTNPAHVQHLPPHWGTLYELTKLSDQQFEAKLAAGDIHPEMERRELVVAAIRERRAEREAELGAFQAALPQRRFGVIYADPAWRFVPYMREASNALAEDHYPTMSLDEIKALDVARIAADDSVLFLWATVPMLPQALAVMEAWSFAYKTGFVWAKDRTGTGYWNRNQHEHLLVGTRGNVPAPAPGTQWPSLIEAPVREHSRKPDQAYALIEAYFPNLLKVELFCRGPARPGWSAWGNEAVAESEAAP
jgi:N6-adenosine-specific RNA methylase IME4